MEEISGIFLFKNTVVGHPCNCSFNQARTEKSCVLMDKPAVTGTLLPC